MKKVVLFDIDYTLFNTDLFRDLTYPRVREILEQEDTPQYHQLVKDIEKSLIAKGGYEPITFAHLITEALAIPSKKMELEALFYDKNVYKKCLYDDVFDTLELLSRKADIIRGIVSKGEETFQRRKIEPVIQYFRNEDIFISENKNGEIQKMKDAYKHTIAVIIDDSQVFLHEVQKKWNDTYTILMERENRYELRVSVEGFIPTATVRTLQEILPLVDKLLAE